MVVVVITIIIIIIIPIRSCECDHRLYFAVLGDNHVLAGRGTGRLLHGYLRSDGGETADRFLCVRLPAFLGLSAAQQNLSLRQHHAQTSDQQLQTRGQSHGEMAGWLKGTPTEETVRWRGG